MPDDTNKNSDKIEKIYHIIEFEIENANNQISLSKKDNINFILLIFALIGFFAFIPADTFFYLWITNSLYILMILTGAVAAFSVFFYYYLHKGKFLKENASFAGDKEKCELCDSSPICKNIDDPIRKDKIQNYVDSILIDNMSLLFSADPLHEFFLFHQLHNPLHLLHSFKGDAPSFQNNSLITFFLILIFIVYILLYFRHSSLLKKGKFKKYLLELAIVFDCYFHLYGLIIEIYGIFSKIPPFIPVANVTQFSPLLIEHLKIIPSVPLSWIVTLYTLVISLVLIELFLSSKYVERINQKIGTNCLLYEV